MKETDVAKLSKEQVDALLAADAARRKAETDAILGPALAQRKADAAAILTAAQDSTADLAPRVEPVDLTDVE